MSESEKELNAFLEAHGYGSREEFRVWETGPNVAYRKEVDGVRFTFTYWWESQGYEQFFWRGELVIVTHLYEPPPKYMHPICVLRIDNVIAPYLQDLPNMEQYLVAVSTVKPPEMTTKPPYE